MSTKGQEPEENFGSMILPSTSEQWAQSKEFEKKISDLMRERSAVQGSAPAGSSPPSSKRLVITFDKRAMDELTAVKENGHYSSFAEAVRGALGLTLALQKQRN